MNYAYEYTPAVASCRFHLCFLFDQNKYWNPTDIAKGSPLNKDLKAHIVTLKWFIAASFNKNFAHSFD